MGRPPTWPLHHPEQPVRRRRHHPLLRDAAEVAVTCVLIIAAIAVPTTVPLLWG